ncbi:iron chaperone [Sharpea azabuensis]|uniref:iron chaperone n=1 Tax=Sharpea azabuensis TaxID=322505 RepID=UPI0009DEB8D4|nr:DUF1801 domain-containing protein [Sharpea azabuensis]
MNEIESYIEKQDETYQEDLKHVYHVIQKAIPEAEEKISWGMPTFHKKHNIIHFACNKKHVGIYPGADGVEEFTKELKEKGYKYSKGAIQFPYDRIDDELITRIALWCYENHSK